MPFLRLAASVRSIDALIDGKNVPSTPARLWHSSEPMKETHFQALSWRGVFFQMEFAFELVSDERLPSSPSTDGAMPTFMPGRAWKVGAYHEPPTTMATLPEPSCSTAPCVKSPSCGESPRSAR